MTDQKNRAGDVLSETEVFARIHQAVQSILELGVDEMIRLHNLVCDGSITVYEDKDGKMLDAGGEPMTEAQIEHEPWMYVFDRGEDEPSRTCTTCGGEGREPRLKEDEGGENCPTCDGSGKA